MAAVVHRQHDLQQVAAVQPQDRAPVGADVADLLQLHLQAGGGVERGREHDVVHLAGAVVLLVDVADLAADQEAHGAAARRRHLVGERRGVLQLEAEQPRLGRFELVAQFGEPAGMGDVAGGHHLHALDLCPLPQVLQRQVLAGGARVVGVQVKVGNQLHVLWSWSCSTAAGFHTRENPNPSKVPRIRRSELGDPVMEQRQGQSGIDNLAPRELGAARALPHGTHDRGALDQSPAGVGSVTRADLGRLCCTERPRDDRGATQYEVQFHQYQFAHDDFAIPAVRHECPGRIMLRAARVLRVYQQVGVDRYHALSPVIRTRPGRSRSVANPPPAP